MDPLSSQSRRAFSMLEMMLTIAIGALVAGVAIPRMGAANARYQADFAAKRVVIDIERCRANARLTCSQQTMTFNTTTHQYTVSGSGTGTSAGFTVDLSASPYKAKITQGTPVTFDAYGQPAGAV